MIKNNKKVFYSVLASAILASSVGHAQSLNFRNINYSLNNNYTTTNTNTITYYLNKNNSNFWQIFSRPSQKPGVPIVITPSKPTTPTTPPTTPTEPTKPTEPTTPPTTPTEPTKPTEPTTPPTTPTQPTTPNVDGLSAIEMEVVRLVNIERQKEGLAPFTASAQLSNVARIKSEDMAKNNYFSHTSPTYGDPFAMMRSFGIKYNTAGENIAKGQLTAQSVVTGWMNSPGHRANIMNPSFKTIGVGHYKSSNGTNYWTQMFTN